MNMLYFVPNHGLIQHFYINGMLHKINKRIWCMRGEKSKRHPDFFFYVLFLEFNFWNWIPHTPHDSIPLYTKVIELKLNIAIPQENNHFSLHMPQPQTYIPEIPTIAYVSWIDEVVKFAVIMETLYYLKKKK